MRREISIRDMDHDKWLEIRKTGIGGSDSSAIVGLNPYMSAFEVYADKLNLIPEKEDTEAMRQGRDLEEYVAQRFCEQAGKKVRRKNAIIFSEEYPFLFANIDRQLVGEEAGLECKTTSILNKTNFKNGEFPPQYYVQCMHYMAVTGFKKWYLAVLVLNKGFHVFEIDRDENEIQALIVAEKYFWEEHILKRVPPAPNGSLATSNVLNTIYADSTPNDIPVDLFGRDSEAMRYFEIEQKIRELKTEKTRLEQIFKQDLEANEQGVCGKYLVNWRKSNRSYVSRELLRKTYPKINIGKVMKSTSFRRFNLIDLEANS